MNIQEFNNIVKETKAKFPIWFDNQEENTSLEESNILKFESEFNLALPKQFKDFILEYGAGYFAFTTIYAPQLEGKWSIAKLFSQYDLPPNFIPFSENGCGDYYGFIVENGVCSETVYFLDHHEPSNSISILNSCFLEFVVKTGLNT